MRLPPLDTLYVFAVTARHQSFTTAAAELHRTQGAVSHRIKALERQLGVRLFNRLARGIELTSAGQLLGRELNEAIAGIARTLATLERSQQRSHLRVTLTPSVASRWLIPRLSRFCERYPDIQLQLIAQSEVLDLTGEQIDLAIRFGGGSYPGYVTTLLMRDHVLPVCAPRLLAEHGTVHTVDALLRLPLIEDFATQDDGSGTSWRSWLDQIGRPDVTYCPQQRFSHAGLAIEAATLGLGVSLGRLSLVADQLSDGTLVCPLALVTPTAFAYYLVAPPDTVSLPPVKYFREWLQQEAQGAAAILPASVADAWSSDVRLSDPVILSGKDSEAADSAGMPRAHSPVLT